MPQLSTRLGTSRISLRSAKWPRTQFANSRSTSTRFPKYKDSEIQVFYGQVCTRTPIKCRMCYSPTSSQARVLVVQASVAAYLQDSPSRFYSYNLLNSRKQRIHTDELRMRATFTCPQPRIPLPGGTNFFWLPSPSRINSFLCPSVRKG